MDKKLSMCNAHVFLNAPTSYKGRKDSCLIHQCWHDWIIFYFQILMSALLNLKCASVKPIAQTLKEGLAASVHSVTLVMGGVMAMDAQVPQHCYGLYRCT